MVNYIPEGTEEDYLTGVINTIKTEKSSVVVFFLKGYVRELSLSGQTLWNYRYNVDEILDKQGVLQSFIDSEICLEPNPSSEYATVRFLASEQLSQVNIVNSKGSLIRTIYQKDVGGTFESSVTFRVSDLANGIYYLVIGNGTTIVETVPLSVHR